MILVAFVFLFVFAVVAVAIGLGLLFDESRRKVQLRQVLKSVIQSSSRLGEVSVILPEAARDGAARFFRRFKLTVALDRMLQQAHVKWSVGRLLVYCLASCGLGAALGAYLVAAVAPAFGGVIVALLAGIAPLLYVLRRRSKLIATLEDQLPEALDFLARSLRGGHGLSIGLELLASESPEPTAGAFRRVANELQLGSSLEDALGRLVEVLPLIDIRFFVSSVLLQQETGGNLSEVLTKLSHIIRERFRLRGQVRAMSAHGRITGMILLLMPIVVALILFLSSPEYLFVLAREREGRYMLWGAFIGQVLAFFTIRKIVNIRV